MTLDVVPAAGGVVARIGPRGIEVLVIHRVRPDEWRLPKGKIAPGEEPEATAVREVREEAGALAEVVAPLEDAEHVFPDPAAGRMRVKHTTYFLMRLAAPNAAITDPDFDTVEWLHWREAAARLTFENEREVVRLAAARLAV
jgi:8-oxo-dGTP diphosphatase